MEWVFTIMLIFNVGSREVPTLVDVWANTEQECQMLKAKAQKYLDMAGYTECQKRVRTNAP